MAKLRDKFPIARDKEMLKSNFTGLNVNHEILDEEKADVLSLFSKTKSYDVEDNASEKCKFYRKGMSRSNSISSSESSKEKQDSRGSLQSASDAEYEELQELQEVSSSEDWQDKVIGETIYHDGLDFKRINDLEKAFLYFRLSSDAHNYIEGSFATGLCYHKGLGVLTDYDMAAVYYSKASIGKHWKAKYNWAMLIINKFITGSMEDAENLLADACMAGLTEAENEYSVILFEKNQNDPLILEYLTRAADKKQPQALFNMGICYENGFGGAIQDLSKALGLYGEASRLGEPNARHNYLELVKHGCFEGIGKTEAGLISWRSKEGAPVGCDRNEASTADGKVILQELHQKEQQMKELQEKKLQQELNANGKSEEKCEQRQQQEFVQIRNNVEPNISDQPELQLLEDNTLEQQQQVQQLKVLQPLVQQSQVLQPQVQQLKQPLEPPQVLQLPQVKQLLQPQVQLQPVQQQPQNRKPEEQQPKEVKQKEMGQPKTAVNSSGKAVIGYLPEDSC